MSIRRLLIEEAVDLIDSPEGAAVLVLLAESGAAAALRSALLDHPATRMMLWMTARNDEPPDAFACRISETLGSPCIGPTVEKPGSVIDRALDALVERPVDYSLIFEGIDTVTDRRVLSVIGYLLDFLPPALRIVFMGAAPGVGVPRLLVRCRARIFRLVGDCP